MEQYLKNCWYVAAFAEEVTRDMLSRKLLNEPVVLYRKENGDPVALTDSCPHRFAPMSEGVLIRDDVRCPYHGLKFDAEGSCVDNPHAPDGKAPKKARLHSYPLLERFGVIWIWPGDPGKVDESILPHFEFLADDNKYKVLHGYLHANGNYQLVSDNLMDLTHAPYIHPEFVVPDSTIEDQLNATETKLIREGNSVTAWRLRKNTKPNLGTISIFGYDKEVLVNSRSHMTWYPPSLIKFDAGTWVVGTDPDEGMAIPQAHLITPETETTCHYFYCAARNQKLDDPAADKMLYNMLEHAFRTQDEPMIGMVQDRMGTSDLNSLDPVLLASDAGPMAARRNLRKLIEDEEKNV